MKHYLDEAFRRRNNKETTEIIDKIRTELYDLLANLDKAGANLGARPLMEKSEYAVTSNELKNQFDIPIQLFLSCIGYQ